MRWPCLILPLMVILIGLFPEAASAHPAQFTTLQVTIDPTGQFHASLNIDILAYALGETSLNSTNEELDVLLNGPRAVLGQKLADAAARFRREIVIRTDAGDVTPASWDLPGLPEVDEVLARKIQPRILMPGGIDFSGTLPAGSHTLSIRLPYILGDTIHVYDLPNGDNTASPVAAGDYSDPVHLDLQVPSGTAGLPGKKGMNLTTTLPQVMIAILLLVGLSVINRRMMPHSRKARHPQ